MYALLVYFSFLLFSRVSNVTNFVRGYQIRILYLFSRPFTIGVILFVTTTFVAFGWYIDFRLTTPSCSYRQLGGFFSGIKTSYATISFH
ncbi:hypothetical protein BJV82DRAFT_336088 [Fennellomyces sp. T-0311]|nr:hypothetical protein BJV82DRAFT_336088 [Fennellomyces sp. T-0311]